MSDIKTKLEKLHQLSMEMEDICSDLQSSDDVDIDEVKRDVETNTATIQDLIDYIEDGGEHDEDCDCIDCMPDAWGD